MKIKENIGHVLFRLCVVAFVASMVSLVGSAQGVGRISWSARLYPDNPDYVEVYVDARAMPTNMIVRFANFGVDFYDAGDRLIKKETFNFLDTKLGRFVPGVYRRYFKHSFANAKRAEGTDFNAYGGGKGGDPKADSPPELLFRASQSGGGMDTPGAREIDPSPAAAPGLEVLVHLEDIGDRTFGANEFAGTRGESRRLEGFQIRLNPPVAGLTLKYFARLQDAGDVFVNEGEYAGTRGESRQLLAFAIELDGPAAAKYNVVYMAHVEGVGDTRFFKNGEFCGGPELSQRIEGILVRILPK